MSSGKNKKKEGKYKEGEENGFCKKHTRLDAEYFTTWLNGL